MCALVSVPLQTDPCCSPQGGRRHSRLTFKPKCPFHPSFLFAMKRLDLAALQAFWLSPWRNWHPSLYSLISCVSFFLILFSILDCAFNLFSPSNSDNLVGQARLVYLSSTIHNSKCLPEDILNDILSRKTGSVPVKCSKRCNCALTWWRSGLNAKIEHLHTVSSYTSTLMFQLLFPICRDS